MQRGDLVILAFQGDYGKPRPALVVQGDAFANFLSVTVAPLTSHLKDAEFFRVNVGADSETGLETPSQVMVDKLASYPREKVSRRIGRVDRETMVAVDRALIVWLGLDNAAGVPNEL